MGCAPSSEYDALLSHRRESVLDHLRQPLADPSHDIRTILADRGLKRCNIVFGLDMATDDDESIMQSDDITSEYTKLINMFGRVLFDSQHNDKHIYGYGFNDSVSLSSRVFSWNNYTMAFASVDDFTASYNHVVGNIIQGQVSSYAPIIRKTMELVMKSEDYHILIIMTDCEIIDEYKTMDAIRDASELPMYIICIGAGNHDYWHMAEFSKSVRYSYRNFKFVRYCPFDDIYDQIFTCDTLLDVADHYAYVRRNNSGISRAIIDEAPDYDYAIIHPVVNRQLLRAQAAVRRLNGETTVVDL